MLQRYLLPVIADDAGRKQLPKGHQLIVFKIVMQRRGLLQTLRQILLKSVKSFTLVFPTQQIGYDTMVKTDNLSKLFPKLLRLPIIIKARKLFKSIGHFTHGRRSEEHTSELQSRPHL